MTGTAAFRLFMPKPRTSCVVFSSPHSGRHYPTGFLNRSILDERVIRSSEDAFVDMLFEAAPAHGAPLLAAVMPRAYLDLNRGPEELDPSVVEGARRNSYNLRVNSGLGVVPRVVAGGREIYRGKLAFDEADRRVARYWRPYHRALQGLLDDARQRFGMVVLIDCHSMPHEALESVAGSAGRRPDVVLGDRFGAAATASVVERVEAIFTDAGLKVARNAPFAGAFIAQHYGRPSRCQHVVQVEIDRALYLDEARVRPSGAFAAFRALMARVTGEMAAIGQSDDTALAAE